MHRRGLGKELFQKPLGNKVELSIKSASPTCLLMHFDNLNTFLAKYCQNRMCLSHSLFLQLQFWPHEDLEFTDPRCPCLLLEPSFILTFATLWSSETEVYYRPIYIHPHSPICLRRILMWEFLQFLLHWTGIQELFFYSGPVLPEWFYNLDIKWP